MKKWRQWLDTKGQEKVGYVYCQMKHRVKIRLTQKVLFWRLQAFEWKYWHWFVILSRCSLIKDEIAALPHPVWTCVFFCSTIHFLSTGRPRYMLPFLFANLHLCIWDSSFFRSYPLIYNHPWSFMCEFLYSRHIFWSLSLAYNEGHLYSQWLAQAT